MSVFAVNIKGGDDLKVVRNASAQMYFTYYAILPVWGYGDPSHRSKLFITGFCILLGMGQAVRSFNFPEPIFEDHCNHTARDWAVPDDQVPNNCWRKDNTSRISQQQPSNGQIHYLSSAGAGMGPPDCPNKVASWDATAPGPTSLNGNNRRPKLSWIDTGFNTVGPSRVTSQVEVPRMPSLPFDYRAWVSKFDSSSGFLWKCVHNGVPVRTAYSLEAEIMDTLKCWFNTRSDTINSSPKGFTVNHLARALIAQAMSIRHLEIDGNSLKRLGNLGTEWTSACNGTVMCCSYSLQDDGKESVNWTAAMTTLVN